MQKHMKGYWMVVACVCITTGIFLPTVQYADYYGAYKVEPGQKSVILVNCLQDGMPDKIICYGNTLETQAGNYDFEIKKSVRREWRRRQRGCEVRLFQSEEGQESASRPCFSFDSVERPHIEWHGKKDISYDGKNISIAEDGTSAESSETDLYDVKAWIASAAIVYLRVKLLQKLLIVYAVFEAALLTVGYLLYKMPEAACCFMHREPVVYRVKEIRYAGVILPLCGAAAIFLIRLAIS